MTYDLAFHAAFRTAAVQLHHELFNDADGKASLVVAGSGAALRQELQDRMPALAGRLPQFGDPPLMSIGSNSREHALRRLAPVARDLALPATILFGVAGLALLALGFGLAPRPAARHLGRRAGRGRGRRPDRGRASPLRGTSSSPTSTRASATPSSRRSGTPTSATCGPGGWPSPPPASWWRPPPAGRGRPRASRSRPRRSRGGRLARAAGLLALAALAVEVPELLLHIALVTLAAGFVYVAAGDLLRVLAPPQGAARGVRTAATTAVLLALIAVAAVPASGTEPLPARVSAATLGPPAKAVTRKARTVCVSADEARWLAAQGAAPPPNARRRADGSLCSKP